ncbi:hypothetical protein DFQ12_1913 [Sphingobacterium detergens]|uniref:Uncharacterized protein n=1 Tax=Sphingobacterium detergens TaxID=1145106 RepID=A0A420BK27_SPHD1|nr:hypothetical protein DFQ12_1913 [Sphingobacterium detergens]
MNLNELNRNKDLLLDTILISVVLGQVIYMIFEIVK